MILLWLATGLLAGAMEPPANVGVGGGGKITFEQALRERESRDRRSLNDLADLLEPERKGPVKKKTTKVADVLPQAAPVSAEPLPPVPAASFDGLMVSGGAANSALQTATLIEMTPQQDDPAAIALLMMMLEIA